MDYNARSAEAGIANLNREATDHTVARGIERAARGTRRRPEHHSAVAISFARCGRQDANLIPGPTGHTPGKPLAEPMIAKLPPSREDSGMVAVGITEIEEELDPEPADRGEAYHGVAG